MVGEESGIDILAALRKADPSVPVVMITGYATVETAVQALKLGAADYVKKPLDFDVLHKIVCGAIRMSRLSEENSILKKRLQEHAPRLVAQSPPMKELVEKIRKLAPTELPVLVTGENGTGKELVADALHEGSHRALAKMMKVNCAAFPESLLDNELFGHERGSYTGADTAYKGVFEQADRERSFSTRSATCRLDPGEDPAHAAEPGDPAHRRLGDPRRRRALHRRHQPARRGADRRGPLPRGRLLPAERRRLSLPPLRERREDIPELTRIFVEEYCLSNGLADEAHRPRCRALPRSRLARQRAGAEERRQLRLRGLPGAHHPWATCRRTSARRARGCAGAG